MAVVASNSFVDDDIFRFHSRLLFHLVKRDWNMFLLNDDRLIGKSRPL
jgi:hypothetical protein